MSEVNKITSSRNDVSFTLIDTITGGEIVSKYILLKELVDVHQYFLVGYVKPQK